MTRRRSTRSSRNRLRTSDTLPTVRIGSVPSAFSDGIADPIGASMTMVFVHVEAGVSVLEKTILSSSAMRARLAPSAASCRYVVAPSP
jgi:hypothetical protein